MFPHSKPTRVLLCISLPLILGVALREAPSAPAVPPSPSGLRCEYAINAEKGRFLTCWSASLLFAGASYLGMDDTAEIHFRRASQLAQEGKVDAAVREYRLGLKAAPWAYQAYNNLGVIYFKQQNLPRAIAAFEQAHRLRPNDPEISFNLGLALYQKGDSAAAIPHLTAGTASQNHFVDAHYLLGACYFDFKQWQGSIKELELARRRRPDGAEILFLLARAYRNVGEPKKSMQATMQLLESHPNSPLVHEMLGESYDVANQPRQAEKEFEQAIAASPLAPQFHFLLGYLYWRWKRYEEAIAPLQQEVRISPNFAPSYFYLGDIALKQGKAEEGGDYFKQALQLDLFYGEAYLGLGRAYVQLGRPRDSIELFRKAAKLLPDKVEPHHWLGRTLIQVGKTEEGRKELAQVERINSMKRRQAIEALNRAITPAEVGGPAAPH